MSEFAGFHLCGGAVYQHWVQKTVWVDLWPKGCYMVREIPVLVCCACNSVITSSDELMPYEKPVITAESLMTLRRVMAENSWLDPNSPDYGSYDDD